METKQEYSVMWFGAVPKDNCNVVREEWLGIEHDGQVAGDRTRRPGGSWSRLGFMQQQEIYQMQYFSVFPWF